LVLLLLATLAHAHVPHEVLPATAFPVDGSAGLPWWVVLDEEDSKGFYRSDDLGQTWNPVWADAQVDILTDGAYTDDGIAAFFGNDRYWWSADGLSWASVDVSFTGSTDLSGMVGGDRLYFAADDGIWAATPGSAPLRELSGVPMYSVFAGAGGPVGIASDGGVYWRQSGTWTRIEPPDGQVLYGATSDDAYVYVGTGEGSVLRWNGTTWDSCGEVPYLAESGTHVEVTRLSTSGGRLLATHAKYGLGVSTDECTSWSGSLAPMTNDFSEDDGSSFTTTEGAYTFIGAVDDRLVIGGYDGVAVSPDDGGSWLHPQIIGADYTRGIAFSSTFSTDGQLLLGAYGTGVTRTFDGGVTFDAPGLGVAASNVQEVLVPDTSAGVTDAYGLFNRILFRSADGGASWSLVSGPFTRVREMDLGPGARVWANDVDASDSLPGAFAFSDDAGANWSTVDTLPSSMSMDIIVHVYDRGDVLCAFSGQRVACSTDDRASFTQVFQAPNHDDQINAVVTWPTDAPAYVLIGDTNGISRVATTGGATTHVWEADGADVRRMTVADDGTILAADAMGRILRSTDGGVTWADMGARLPTQIKVMKARPDYATWPELLIGGMAGTYLVSGDGTVSRFGAYQRVDDYTQYVTCEGCVAITDASAGMGRYLQVDAGQVYVNNLRGHTIRVIGGAPADATAELRVDGVVAWSGTVSSAAFGSELMAVDGLADAWHLVELTVTGGTLDVDGMEGIGDGVRFSGFDAVDTGDTGGTVDTGDTSDTGDSGDSGETADTGESGDTSVDTSDTSDTSGAGDDTADTGPAEETGTTPKDGCGCATPSRSPSSLLASALGAAILLVGARRRR